MVGIGGLGVSDRAVVNEGELIAETIFYVSIEGVEAGVQHSIGKPVVNGCRGVVQDDCGLAVPVNALGRFAPKAHRIVNASFPDILVSTHSFPR